MSFIRVSSSRKYSKKGDGMYVYSNGGEIVWTAGNPKDKEDLVELICRINNQAGIEMDLEKVNKIRDRLHLDELEGFEGVKCMWCGEEIVEYRDELSFPDFDDLDDRRAHERDCEEKKKLLEESDSDE